MDGCGRPEEPSRATQARAKHPCHHDVLPVTHDSPSHRSSPGAQNETDDVDAAVEEPSAVSTVNGKVAHFEMSYSPPARSARAKFGPPWSSRILSTAYLAFAAVLGGVVLYAYTMAPSSSALFGWIVGGDRGRPVPANVLAGVIVVSAVATAIRTQMRGVLVSEDWIESRALLPLGIPRFRRWNWAQVLRVVIDRKKVAIELWDGTFEKLPEVAKAEALVSRMLREATRKNIDVTVLHPTE